MYRDSEKEFLPNVVYISFIQADDGIPEHLMLEDEDGDEFDIEVRAPALLRWCKEILERAQKAEAKLVKMETIRL